MGYGLYFFIDIQTSSKPQQKTRLVVIEDKDESPGTTRASHPRQQERVIGEDKHGLPGQLHNNHAQSTSR